MKAMGIIFANIYDSSLGELTNKRTIASLPYGGRYRQIDFTLSNMSNSGIRHIGVITKYNYQSLMNHIGSGQEWDLDLEEGGLEYLTPFALGHNGSYRGKLEALNSAMVFLENSLEEYVILADSNVLCNIDLEKVLERHVASGKDITVVVKEGIANGTKQLDLGIRLDEQGQLADVAVDYCAGPEYLASMGIFVISRELLIYFVKESVARSRYRFERDFLLKQFNDKTSRWVCTALRVWLCSMKAPWSITGTIWLSLITTPVTICSAQTGTSTPRSGTGCPPPMVRMPKLATALSPTAANWMAKQSTLCFSARSVWGRALRSRTA